MQLFRMFSRMLRVVYNEEYERAVDSTKPSALFKQVTRPGLLFGESGRTTLGRFAVRRCSGSSKAESLVARVCYRPVPTKHTLVVSVKQIATPRAGKVG